MKLEFLFCSFYPSFDNKVFAFIKLFPAFSPPFVASCCRRVYTQLDSLMGIVASKHASEQENFFSVLEACCFLIIYYDFRFLPLDITI